MTPREVLEVAVPAAGLAVVFLWRRRALRGTDPLGPRATAPFGDTTPALAVACAAYLAVLFGFRTAADALGLDVQGRTFAFAAVHLVFALALLRPALRAAGTPTLPRAHEAAAGLLGGLATFGIVAVVGLALQAAYAAAGAPLPEQEVVRAARDPSALVVSFLSAGVLAPFAEEVFWRGILLPSLLRGAPERAALLAQALAFGAVHVAGAAPSAWPLALPLAVVGWAAGWLLVRTRSLAAAALLHAAFNLLHLLFLRSA